ncbi:ZmpA/ZmpB/ZmpC family metallo-endopeptidase-related protein [Vibrio lentus]|uniref:ZmpA/ZmpB/ZmpC family metallo-endopeptidase-related protein n=1 Tax=Vibrio lentus TaxID=136468 RepID=UPI001F52CC75|nr:ZmpA/ZmpB/ZmpC family metallo-endopeptidase-related protein [Vibrio lentus]
MKIKNKYGILIMRNKCILFTTLASMSVAASPIHIDTCEALLNLEDNTNLDYEIIHNLDCSGIAHSELITFRGNLNGNGHTISNLTISSSQNDIGLFSQIHTGEVRNLTLQNFNINSQNQKVRTVGGLAGFINGGLVKDVTVTDSSINNSQGDWATGLLAGRADNAMIQNVSILNSTLTTTTDSRQIGGALGWIIDGAGASNLTVHDVQITIKGSGNSKVGGILGNVVNTPLSSLEIIDSSLKRNDLGKNGKNGLLVGQLDKSTIQHGSIVNVSQNLALGKYNGIAVGVLLKSNDNLISLSDISHNDADTSLLWHYVNPRETYNTHNLYLDLSNESTLPPPTCQF